MKFLEPANFLDEKFVVRSYESGVANRVSLPSLCNYMQEAAGISADTLQPVYLPGSKIRYHCSLIQGRIQGYGIDHSCSSLSFWI